MIGLKILFPVLVVVFSVHFNLKNDPPFAAKFYDDTGNLLGLFGKVDKDSPIYIVSCEILFPDKFKAHNGSVVGQTPSLSDFRFSRSYPTIKQHFVISLKYNCVYYYGFGLSLPSSGEAGGYHFRVSYEHFFALE